MTQPSPPPKSKLGGYDFYRQVLGSPRYVVAPMVDQSELPWRILGRRYGAQLVYTPMINAKLFVDPKNPKYRDINFNIPATEEGSSQDRPLIVQFCGNDPDLLLQAAKIVELHCDAVDINLGCPQDIARRGRYGSFLQDDWDLVYRLTLGITQELAISGESIWANFKMNHSHFLLTVNILHTNLAIPVTAKFRVFPSIQKTVEYAQMIERAGAQILTCHGRTREQRGQNSGLADWDAILAVKQAVKVPVFANGNVLYASDVPRCLAYTGADAIMSAEGHLYNAALFAPLTTTTAAASGIEIEHPPHAELALEYLTIVRSLKTRTALSAVKGHLFKIMRPALSIETDLRDRLGKARGPDTLNEYWAICEEMRVRMQKAADAVKHVPLGDLIQIDDSTGLKVVPHWLAQPYFRPLPPVEKGKTKGAPKVVKDVTNASIDVETEPEVANAIKRPHSPLPSATAEDRDEVKRTKR